MPNTRDLPAFANKRLLITGPSGQGKTTLFKTLPGRKFIFIFDPNSLASLQGADIDYEYYPLEAGTYEVSGLSLATRKTTVTTKLGLTEYQKFTAKFTEMKTKGFEGYDWIGVDSFTLLSLQIEHDVLALNNRLGQNPVQGDHSARIGRSISLIRDIIADTGKAHGIYMTAHTELMRNEVTGRQENLLYMSQAVRVAIPQLFTDIYFAQAEGERGKPAKFTLQTVPSSDARFVRCSLQGLDPMEDVTLQARKPLEDQGVGALLRKAGIVLPAKPTTT